jgi:hypothetical protein
VIQRFQAGDVLGFDLLADRYRQRLPMLVATNRRKEIQSLRLDRSVMDRLWETCAMVEVIGPNQPDQKVQQGQQQGGSPN